MPRMSSPDGSEVLTVPDTGIAPLQTLGWSVEGQPSDPPEPERDKPERDTSKRDTSERRRGPGRPRKNPDG